MSIVLTITLTSNLPQAPVLTSQNVSTVSLLAVKLRKTESQFMWDRLVSLSWATFVSFLAQPKLSIFECSAEQRSDLNNNFWLDSVTARAYTARTTGVVYHVHFRARLIKILNKFFEKILGEWSIYTVEKSVIKFSEKGKRKGKTCTVLKSCSRTTKNVFFINAKHCKQRFLF